MLISMLCVYYRLEVQGPVDSSEKTEDLECLFNERRILHYDYLHAVTNFSFQRQRVFTSNVGEDGTGKETQQGNYY